MKHFFASLMIVLTLLSVGCNKKDFSKPPEAEQIRSICQLSTLECYYNNVAKSTKTADHFWEKDRELWIEYEGYAIIGIDMNQVSFELNENHITITMPSAEILKSGKNTETLNKDSYICSKDGILFKNPVTVEDQEIAIAAAQQAMLDTIRQNSALFLQAEQQAKDLIENYINQLGKISGTTYEITWQWIPNAQ